MVGAPIFFPLDGQTKGGIVVGTTRTLYKLMENTEISNVVVVAKEGNSTDLWHKQLSI